MARRQLIALASCGMLAGCSPGAPSSYLAFPDIPRMTVPEIHLMGMPLYGEKPGEQVTPTTAYRLSQSENETVRRTVARSFPASAELVFYPLRAGVTDSGPISVCGMVGTRSADGAADTRLFRGDMVRQTASGGPDFSVRQLAGANATTIEIFGDCQKQGLA